MRLARVSAGVLSTAARELVGHGGDDRPGERLGGALHVLGRGLQLVEGAGVTRDHGVDGRGQGGDVLVEAGDQRVGGQRAAGDLLEEVAGSLLVAVEIGQGLLDGGVIAGGLAEGVVDEEADVVPPQLEEGVAVLGAGDAADGVGEGDAVLVEGADRGLHGGVVHVAAGGDGLLDGHAGQVHVLLEQRGEGRPQGRGAVVGGGVGRRGLATGGRVARRLRRGRVARLGCGVVVAPAGREGERAGECQRKDLLGCSTHGHVLRVRWGDGGGASRRRWVPSGAGCRGTSERPPIRMSLFRHLCAVPGS